MLVRSLGLHPLVLRGQRLGQSYFEHANVHYDIHSVLNQRVFTTAGKFRKIQSIFKEGGTIFVPINEDEV